MKKLCCILCILLVCFNVQGCGGRAADIPEGRKNEVESTRQEDIINTTALEPMAVKAVETVVGIKQSSVREKDLNKYMNTVNKEDKEYYTEQKHWFQDILVNDIKDYKLQVLKVEKNSEGVYLVELNQSYTFKDKNSSLKYKALFKDTGAGIIDCGLNFKQKQTEHFVVKYMEKSQDLAEDFAKAAEEGYALAVKNYGKAPEDKTEIKIYDDMDTLRQFVKLSFRWDMAGWYEYSEAIKFIGWKNEVRAEGLAHELIHKVTIKDTNNNMPYWLAEGLATHYTEKAIAAGALKERLSIEEMQAIDLEALTDNAAVYTYYKSAQAAVESIIGKYGEEALKNILKELSKYPFQDLTGSEVNKKNIQLFDKAVMKVLGRGTSELDKELKFPETK